MIYLIYVSSAVKLMNGEELESILKASRRKNSGKNITGMLLYVEGSFIQVLEGKPEDVNSTFEIIKKDKRHKNVIKVIQGDLTTRNFPDWVMGYLSAKKEDIKNLEGYLNPTDNSFLSTSSVHPAIMVLKTFAETNKRYFKH